MEPIYEIMEKSGFRAEFLINSFENNRNQVLLTL